MLESIASEFTSNLLSISTGDSVVLFDFRNDKLIEWSVGDVTEIMIRGDSAILLGQNNLTAFKIPPLLPRSHNKELHEPGMPLFQVECNLEPLRLLFDTDRHSGTTHLVLLGGDISKTKGLHFTVSNDQSKENTKGQEGIPYLVGSTTTSGNLFQRNWMNFCLISFDQEKWATFWTSENALKSTISTIAECGGPIIQKSGILYENACLQDDYISVVGSGRLFILTEENEIRVVDYLTPRF
jgi:hypothetical protein